MWLYLKGPYGASGNSLMASKSYLVIMCHLHAPSTTTNSVYTFPSLLESFYSYPVPQNGWVELSIEMI